MPLAFLVHLHRFNVNPAVLAAMFASTVRKVAAVIERLDSELPKARVSCCLGLPVSKGKTNQMGMSQN